jgi:RimJ/RimL family protein N-acetyltransferase
MRREFVIEAPAVVLRRFVPADAERAFRMSQEEGMRTWIPSQVYRDLPHAASVLGYLISQYDTGEDPRTVPIVFGIQLRATAELVGHVGLSPFDGAVEIGYAVESSHRRKGLATEAVRAACVWATTEFPIRTILGITAARNIASQSVLLRAGFLRKRQQIMQFQGLAQPVIFFEFSKQPPECGAPPNAGAAARSAGSEHTKPGNLTPGQVH